MTGRPGRIIWAALVTAVAATACAGPASTDSNPIRIGAVYPLSGSQGSGGIEEFRGVQLAAALVNRDGGVNGRPIRFQPVDTPSSDAAPAAVDQLAHDGIRLVVGSYGSTISEPAAAEAARRGMLFWETGAVGEMSGDLGGRRFFRVAPTGATLGRAAVDFVAGQMAPRLGRAASSLRFAVANVDDLYGRAVADGALQEIRAMGLPLAGRFPYDPLHLDAAKVVQDIAASKPDVLFVSAYLQDGIALRREMVRQHLSVLVNIGTSSSYCMPAFGQALGTGAVGLFASDKPDADSIDASGLTPEAAGLLQEARSAYRARYHAEMTAPALAGFSAGWALFHDVLPQASSDAPADVVVAALRTRVPVGGLSNGSGLEFGPDGTDLAGSNLRAVSVIWEWVGVGERRVVWPPRFATGSIVPAPSLP